MSKIGSWYIIGINEKGEFYDSISTTERMEGRFEAQCTNCLSIAPIKQYAGKTPDKSVAVFKGMLSRCFLYCPICGARMTVK